MLAGGDGKETFPKQREQGMYEDGVGGSSLAGVAKHGLWDKTRAVQDLVFKIWEERNLRVGLGWD